MRAKFRKATLSGADKKKYRKKYGAAVAASRLKRAKRSVRARYGLRKITGSREGVATSSSVLFRTKTLNAKPQVARAIKMIGAPNSYIINTQVVFKSDTGFQNVTSFQHLGQQALKGIRATLGTSLAARFVVEEYQSEISFTNSTTAPCEVEVYDVCAKRDLASAGATYDTTSYTYPLPQTPEAYWTTGAQVQTNTNPAGTFNPRSIVGSSPMDIQLFRENFTIVKRVNVSLPQGATHRHMCLQKPNYVVTDAMLKNSQISAEVGLCYWTMFVLKGYPVGSSAPTDPLTWASTIGQAQLSMVQATRIKYSWSADISNTLVQTNQLGQVQYEIVNVGSGLVEPIDYT